MKKFIFLIALFFGALKLPAQDCTQYVYMQKGKTIETTSYNAAGVVTGKIVHYIADVTTVNGTTTETVNTSYFDKNGNPGGTKNIVYKCNGGKFMMDMSANNPQQAGVSMSTSYIEYPANMRVGDHFKDVDMKMDMTMGGKTYKAESKITDRQVVGEESITTPAGTWHCLKITYKTTSSFEGMNMPARTMESTEWYAANFGIIQFQVGSFMTTRITAIK